MGKKSNMSFCPSSKRPKESAIEFDMVQLGASIVLGNLARGGLAAGVASLFGIDIKFGSLSLGIDVPALSRGSSKGAKGGAF